MAQFSKRGVVYFSAGRLHESHAARGGLGAGRIATLRYDSEKALWATTPGGLSRLNNGHVATLTAANALPCSGVQWMLEDDENFVWLNLDCGLARIARSELTAWAGDPKRRMTPTHAMRSTKAGT